MVEVAAIRRIPRFAGVSAEAHEWLARSFERRSVGKGQVLFVEGEDAASLLLVEQGVVKVFRSHESGNELILAMFQPGEAVGEVALLDGQPYPASAAAHEDSELLVMPRESWMHYLEHTPGAAIALVRDLTIRLRKLQRRMEDLGGGDVEYRIARVLQGFCASCAEGDGPVVVPVRLARQDIADMVGARVETVIRILSRWQRAGIVGNDERGMWIRDRRTLESLGKT